MSPKLGARVLLFLGFLAASVSYSSWIANRTVLDPSATRGATHALLTAPSVRSTLAREIRNSLAPELGSTVADPKLTTAINAAVADPRFVTAFEDAIASIHAAVLSDTGGRVTLDTRAVTAALRDSVARHDPALAPRIRNLGTVKVPLGSTKLPHIGSATHWVTRVGTIALLLAVLLIGGALLLAHDAKTIRRVGRRTAFLAFGPGLAFVVVPRLLEISHNGTAAVAAAVLHAYGHRVMFSAFALAVVGASTWLTALVAPVILRRSIAAAAGPAEPLPVGFARSSRERTAPEEITSPLPEKLYL
jgi:hypothetical protein